MFTYEFTVDTDVASRGGRPVLAGAYRGEAPLHALLNLSDSSRDGTIGVDF